MHFSLFFSKEGTVIADGWLARVVFPRACCIELQFVLGCDDSCKELQTVVLEEFETELVCKTGAIPFSDFSNCAGLLGSPILGSTEAIPLFVSDCGIETPLFCAGGRASEGLIKTEIPLGVAAVGNECLNAAIIFWVLFDPES